MPPSPHPPDSEEPDSIQFDMGEPVRNAEPPAPSREMHSAREEQGAKIATPTRGTPARSGTPSSPVGIETGTTGRGTLAWVVFPGLFIPALLLLVALLAPVARRVELGLRFPYQLDAEEGFLYLQALDLSEGRSIYTPISEEPYLVGNYPPLYPALVAGMLDLGFDGLRAGRLVVAGAAILVAALLFLIARMLSGSWAVAPFAPLLFLVSYEFYNWSPFCRVDLPALALTLAGVFLFVTFSSRFALVATALCFVLAAYSRQTALLAPAACGWVLLLKDRRGLVIFLTPYLVVGLGGFVILNGLLHGEFWRHLVAYNRNEMDWPILRSILKNEIWFFYRWWIVATFCAVAFAGIPGVAQRAGMGATAPSAGRLPRHRYPLFLGAYFVLAALSLSAFAKSGSAPNYLLEPLAATALLFSWALGRMAELSASPSNAVRRWALVGLFIVSLALDVHVTRLLPIDWPAALPSSGLSQSLAARLNRTSVAGPLFSSPNPDDAETLRGDRVVAQIRETRGPVLSELPVFSIMAGRDVVFQPFIMSRLAREGQWDPTPFVEDLREGRFALILTTQDLRDARRGLPLARYTPAMAEAILQRYDLAEISAPGALRVPYFIWRPKPA